MTKEISTYTNNNRQFNSQKIENDDTQLTVNKFIKLTLEKTNVLPLSRNLIKTTQF